MAIKGARSKDKLLFTPGPLTTSLAVKQAMLRDLGSRDQVFIGMVKEIRQKLVAAGSVANRGYEAIPIQGSGTFGLESVLGSAVPRSGKILILVNGAYGKRLAEIASVLKIPATVMKFPEDTPPDPQQVASALTKDKDLTMVVVVHCETTTGILNPIKDIGDVTRNAKRLYFVDAMSSFGGLSLDVAGCGIDYLVSSANKCLEGVPGFAFVIARQEALLATEGYARSLSLNLLAQWNGLEKDGQFRFTPPTHALMAFHQALVELEEEGGVEARAGRYRDNYAALTEGMRAMGFKEYLRPELQSPIIVSYRYPEDPGFNFETFYAKLNDRGYVIYPGKVSDASCFRIGCIGRIFPEDMRDLVGAIREVIGEMGLKT